MPLSFNGQLLQLLYTLTTINLIPNINQSFTRRRQFILLECVLWLLLFYSHIINNIINNNHKASNNNHKASFCSSSLISIIIQGKYFLFFFLIFFVFLRLKKWRRKNTSKTIQVPFNISNRLQLHSNGLKEWLHYYSI